VSRILHISGIGDLVFVFLYSVPDDLTKKSLRYQRVDIDYGGPDLADGLITRITDTKHPCAWVLTIMVGTEYMAGVQGAIERQDVAIRVVG
jgi:hypothetical protein